jgi:hypothetical protein
METTVSHKCSSSQPLTMTSMGETGLFDDLPSFDRPPVVEVAVGTHFLQLPGLNTVALVRLVDDLWRSRYPRTIEQPLSPPFPQLGRGPYPRYKKLRRDFVKVWREFSNYIDDRDFGVLQPSIAEVSLFNLVPMAAATEVPMFVKTLVLKSLDTAHHIGVSTFDAVTTENAQSAWGRHDAGNS